LIDGGVLPLAACELLCRGLLEQARELALGEGMLTVNLDVTTEQDPRGEIRLQRIWSSRPQAYPVGGGKTKTLTPWSRQLLQRGEVFVGEGDEALAQVFDDHARIASLNLHAVVNVPLLRAGRCAATFNVLGVRPGWQPHEIAAIELLGLLAAPYVLRP
jgi:hypothetical protein